MGNWSNRLQDGPPPNAREAIERAVRHLRDLPPLRADRLILPPDWETRFPPDVVAEIKRQLGR